MSNPEIPRPSNEQLKMFVDSLEKLSPENGLEMLKIIRDAYFPDGPGKTRHHWTGGKCPVDRDTQVRFWTRNRHSSVRKAHELDWDYTKTEKSWDIVAYEVLDDE